MPSSRRNILAVLTLTSAMTAALAAPSSYVIQATATGDVNGPINGMFSIDLGQIAMTQTYSLATGETDIIQKEEFDLYYGEWGLIDWHLAGEYRQSGSYGAPAGAVITRSLLPGGGSSLTLDTSAAFSHGSMGYQHFTLTYTSDTDELFAHADQVPALDHITSATGSYEFAYAPSYYDPLTTRKFNFTVNTTSVPEPDLIGLMAAGMLTVGAFRVRRPSR
ncbi:MAG TPA: hypothetical protein VFW93_06650 [Aquabacterium sp.]|uniref:hypothetical protein n=1 Tax=Aquabacterium sp. TaxID=1872578 RepID=UPI002E326E6B|nr:hypothetical protein [Aquabacterium sp.]HEX5355876.1 hypothetical protein [Aquabacterium sp.]